jgi:hypothetical protein
VKIQKRQERRSQKIACIKRNKEVFKLKSEGKSLSQARLDPQNETFLDGIKESHSQENMMKENPDNRFMKEYLNQKIKKDRKTMKISRRKIEKQKVRENESETSDVMESLEEEQSENEREEEIKFKGITQFEMQNQIEAWKAAIEEAEVGKIPIIYLKDFKKIKVGLKKKMDELSLIFNRINASGITGKDNLETDYIQMAYKFMTHTLQERIKNAIGKSGKKVMDWQKQEFLKRETIQRKVELMKKRLNKIREKN